MTWFTVLAVITAALALGLPPDPHTLHQLHISAVMYRVAVVLLLVPYGIIWYAAFFAYAKLKEYTQSIKDSDDGKAFHRIMIGMGLLAFGLIIPTAIAQILTAVTIHHPGFKPSSVIIENYIGILAGLIALVYINNGTYLLGRLTKNRPGLTGSRIFVLFFLAIGTVFTYLVLNYHNQHHDAYYLNTPLLIGTFIIPELFGWFIAILSAYEFGIYAKFVKGSLYRKILRQFSRGIIIAIAASVAGEFVDNSFAAKVSNSLGSLLLVEYVLLIVLAYGLILMALGAKKLKKIEEA